MLEMKDFVGLLRKRGEEIQKQRNDLPKIFLIATLKDIQSEDGHDTAAKINEIAMATNLRLNLTLTDETRP